MALARYVVTAPVTVPAATPAAVTAGEPGTGAQAGYGSIGTVSPSTSGKHGWLPVIWADLARMQDQTCAQVPGSTGNHIGYLDRARPARL
jgi:hypothetical protein